jgi:hypothetical protein
LHHAILKGSRLEQADFTRTYLESADFSGATLWLTRFSSVNLSWGTGLESIKHRKPSLIDFDTSKLSSGKIPEVFLRCCGVSDELISYAVNPRGAGAFHSCFISYSTIDQDFADRLYTDLQARGVRCWFAPHDIQGGRKIHQQIDEAILIYDKLLLVLSDASMSSSWVKTEIANARAREHQQDRQMLFPIALVSFDRIRKWKGFDADTGIDSAREIRGYHVPDFSAWRDPYKSYKYEAASQRLLRDLKAVPSGSAVPVAD